MNCSYSTMSAIIRRLNAYLIDKGLMNVSSMKKSAKVRHYCNLENISKPFGVSINDFLILEYERTDSKISKNVKPPKRNKPIKNKDGFVLKEKYKQDRKLAYNKYILSNEWASFRRSIIKERGYRCEICGCDDKVIHAHHLTYERFMRELPQDIQLLCVPCHRKVHDKKDKSVKGKKKQKEYPVKEIPLTKRDIALQERYDSIKNKKD
jgi:5-methylcytosine-specific restriction endonuclease McrA